MRLSAYDKRRIENMYRQANAAGDLDTEWDSEAGEEIARLASGAGDEALTVFRVEGPSGLQQIFAYHPQRGALFIGYENSDGSLYVTG